MSQPATPMPPSPPSPGRRVGRTVLWPLRRFFDPRFETVNVTLEHTVAQVGAAVAGQNEVLSFMRQELERLGDEIERINSHLGPVADHQGARVAMAEGVASLDGDLAAFLNFADSHVGFRSERSLWFNDPLSFRYSAGDVDLDHVNERIVEIPFAYRALADIPPGGRVLDVGACESTVSFALAALGYRVTALDLRPYPLEHHNLTAIAQRLEDAALEPGSFDAVLCISSIEHFGLESYGATAHADDADRAALRRIRDLLRPGGRLVLTVPYGVAGVDEFQRVYDGPGLDRLLEGWSVSSRLVLEQRSPLDWVGVDEASLVPDASRRYVALVTGEPPAG